MTRRGKAGSRRSGGGRAIEQRPADRTEARFVEDPITVGLDKTINIDLTKVSAPANIYDADVAWVTHQPGLVSLFFGKRSLNEQDRLRTRLELRYPAENVVHHFWNNSRGFHERLRAFVSLWPDFANTAPQPAGKWHAEKDHSEWVNFEAIAHAGTEATLDFYSIPAVGIARFRRGGGSASLSIVPVVRVNLTVFELLRLMDAIEPVVKDIGAYLPKKGLPPDEGEVVLEEGKKE